MQYTFDWKPVHEQKKEIVIHWLQIEVEYQTKAIFLMNVLQPPTNMGA